MTTQFPVVKTTDAVVSDGNIALPISRTDGKKGKSGLCIVVPQVSDSVITLVIQNQIGMDWIQDGINSLRSTIASGINKAGNVITSDKLGIDAILAAMKAATDSQRMTKESIGVWFDADMAALISARIKEKMPQIAEDKIAVMVEHYKAKFQTLSGRDVSMPDAVKLQLLAALELLPEDYENAICTKVTETLDKVQEASEVLVAL